jgi:hypothetical protein
MGIINRTRVSLQKKARKAVSGMKISSPVGRKGIMSTSGKSYTRRRIYGGK